MSKKDVQPVAKVHVHKTGGNAGVQWSAVAVNGYDSLPLLEDGTLLYLAPPAADVQELVEALRQLCSIVEIHQDATGNNFAWAELPDAFEALAKWEGK